LTIGDEDALLNYAKGVVQDLRAHQVRVEGDFSTDPIKAKIADAENRKVHTMLVVGARDMEAGQLSVRLHGKGPQGAKPKGEVIAGILQAIQQRQDD
jgi:threonyl-tRNA synthetase